ncbi:DUF6232 family protein [Mesobacillus jeotgali]|uniref:DUF6232 family protein n=1 Tax=Mesobacillus jeotgali TaxID=129985 RepID=UPI001CFDCF09|nr:DUF6232 family protein [Mesobacillus jeotgali]
MEEHVFLKNEMIIVTSTRLVIENKTIAMNSLCSVELDCEDINPPWVTLSLTFFGFLIGFLSHLSELGWTMSIIGAVLSILLWVRKREEAVILELSSGEKEYITNKAVNDLDSVFKAINDVIIFRG